MSKVWILFAVPVICSSIFFNLSAQTYREDSLVVVEILKANGLDTVPVTDVAIPTGDRITELLMMSKGMRVLPDCVGELSALTNLSLDGNDLMELPQAIGALSKLEYISCNDNRIAGLPASVLNLRNLKYAFFIRNRLTEFPEVFFTLRNLETVDLGGNHLTQLPANLSQQCPALIKLYINDNYLIQLPETIVALNLELIHVAGNALCNVSQAVTAWLDGRDYYKENSKWRTYQDCSGAMVDSSRVRRLLDDNGLTSIPVSSVVQMKDGFISGIDLSLSKLGTIKPSVTTPREITLPDDLFYMKHLRSLNLAGQSLDSLPQGLDLLCHIESLNLSNNRLTTLPDYLASFRNLAKLDLSGNRLANLSDATRQWADALAPEWRSTQKGSSARSGKVDNKIDIVKMINTGSGSFAGIQVRFREPLLAEIILYSLSGRRVTLVIKKRLEPGVYEFSPGKLMLPRGAYVVAVKSGNRLLDALKTVWY
jgi:Leucine-rich repeat (LRR) protein